MYRTFDEITNFYSFQIIYIDKKIAVQQWIQSWLYQKRYKKKFEVQIENWKLVLILIQILVFNASRLASIKIINVFRCKIDEADKNHWILNN